MVFRLQQEPFPFNDNVVFLPIVVIAYGEGLVNSLAPASTDQGLLLRTSTFSPT
jgi:hypothetical protein